MDIRCPRCGEPWDEGEFEFADRRDLPPAARALWDAQFFGQLQQAIWDVRREYGDEFADSERGARVIEGRAKKATAFHVFRRFGCAVFGTRCSPNGSEAAERARVVLAACEDLDDAVAALDD